MLKPSFAGNNAGEHDLERTDTMSSTGTAGRNESSPQAVIQPAAFLVGSSPRASLNPLENEAETLILKAIEQQEDFQRNHSRNDAEYLSLLSGNVSSEAMNGFLGNGNAEANNEPMSSDVPVKRRYSLSSSLALQRNQSTEEALANLNMVMEAIQEEQEHPVSQSETSALFDTTHRVFHGNQRALTRGQSSRGEIFTGSASSEHSPPTRGVTSSLAMRNWEKLRQAVQSSRDACQTSPTADEASSKPHDDTSKTYREEEEAFVDLERIGERNVVSMPEPDPNGPMTHCNPSAQHSTRRNMNRKMGSNGAVADLKLFVKQHRHQFFLYFKVLFLVVSTALIVSCLLFYLAGTYDLPGMMQVPVFNSLARLLLRLVLGNPPTGRIDVRKSTNDTLTSENGLAIDPHNASASWWILFICVSARAEVSSLTMVSSLTIEPLLVIGTTGSSSAHVQSGATLASLHH
jgi:hypothetical protein